MSRIPRILPLVAVALAGVAAVRLIGAGPDLFQGARAWAEGVAETAAPAEGGAPAQSRPAPAPACAVSPEELARQAGLSPAELRILQNLSARRGELDARDVDFDTQLPLLIVAEAKANDRIAELTALRGEINTLLGTMSEREQAEVDRLVAVYQAMRPRDAAPIFATLDDEVRLPVAAAMRPRSLSAIMAQMDPAAARVLTERLANRFGTSRFSQAVAAAGADAQPPASTATGGAAGAPAATPPQQQTPRPRPTQTSQPAQGGQQTPSRAASPTPPRRQQPAATPPPSSPSTPAPTPPAPDASGAGSDAAQQPRVGVS